MKTNKLILPLFLGICVLGTTIRTQAQSIYEPYAFTTFAGLPPGSADGTGSNARFDHPSSGTVDIAGNLYIADTYNHTIRKISPGGVVITLAGLAGNSGSADGIGSGSRFYYPGGVVVDSAGNLYVADTYNHTIRQITPGGVVTTLVGSAGNPGSADGSGSNARFSYPTGLTVDSAGNVYVADTSNHTIRKITLGGTVTTLAGLAGNFGSADGTGSAARFYGPGGVTVDNGGNLYVADTFNHTIRKITSAGVVTTLAGLAGNSGSANGIGSNARFTNPYDVTVDSAGNLYVADYNNHTIRKILPNGMVTTLAGLAGNRGSADGTGSNARFLYPRGITVDSASTVYVADFNYIIRKITPGGGVTTLAGLASPGTADGNGSNAKFFYPAGVTVDSAGNLYVADNNNSTIRKITTGGTVTTLAGLAGTSGSADGTGSNARFGFPYDVTVDGAGNVYVADTTNFTIRKITPGGMVTTLAGLAGNFGSADGVGSNARFYAPRGVTVDSASNLYVADTFNHTIRKITSGGVVTTLVGSAGNPGSADGTGTNARFSYPHGLTVDSGGNLHVADNNNHTIRKITPSGVVSTLAGLAGNSGSTDGTGSNARFSGPIAVTTDSEGSLYVADTFNHTIRKITPDGVVTTLAGLPGNPGYADGAGTAARFNSPYGIAVDSARTVYVADTLNNNIRKGEATTTATPTPTATPGATPSPTAIPSATPFATPTPTATAAPSATATPVPGHAGNISTRLRVETGDNVLIGGFIVSGTQPKRLIIRAIGPSLTGLGVPGALANPTLALHGPNGFVTVTNDNWMDAPNRQEIIDSGLAPTNSFESAILVTLPANNAAYTAIVQGVNNGTGVALVEVYDLNTTADSKLANISTRGFVQAGDNVMIGGFIVVGQSATRVVLRAIGPSLPIPGKLADPTLELRDVSGTLLRSDDNWRTGGQEAEINQTGLQPSSDLESAIISTLNPGNYTAIMRGVNNGTGIGLIEAYDLGPP
jgi:sugar lactone lactonase YvrE